ncbi:MAG: 16S rRNA (adenine(1518)-N(6)/adenine(1519)-N(6))-dimethyltransferase RsmA [Burkholderiales bacterium]
MPSSSHRPVDKKPHVARRRFGQHFLHEKRVLGRIVEALAPASQDLVIEIGPGEGALTEPLLEKVARLEAIELDRDLASGLAARFPPWKLTVHCADALGFDFARFPAGMRLVGNLPYNVSTPLLFHLARFATRVRDMHFMLQLEVVERMVAKPSTPAYGRLSVSLQARFQMKKLFNVSRGAFRPPPKVESALVRMQPLDWQLPVDEELLRKAFSARRKTLRNALPGIDFAAAGIDPGLRPENLSPEDYARLSARSVL